MNLDHVATIQELDILNMGAEIAKLPSQLEAAWELGKSQPGKASSSLWFLPVLISGMGGSAIGADLVAAYIAPNCNLPVFVHRDYGLPAWAHGPKHWLSLRPTRETPKKRWTRSKLRSRLIAACGSLHRWRIGKRASTAGVPVWKFEHAGQPRAAVGFSFGLLLSAFTGSASSPLQS